MKPFIIVLSFTFSCFNFLEVFANTSSSTKIGLKIVIKEVIPCQFEFSLESNIEKKGISYSDSFDCSTHPNKLIESANKVVLKTKQISGFNRVRVIQTVE